MQINYWKKDTNCTKIITQTQILNKGNFKIYANYYNFIDLKGLGLQLSSNSNIEVLKLFRKNGFEYIVLEHDELKELFILPNEKIVEYANRIFIKINYCKNEDDILHMLIEEMN